MLVIEGAGSTEEVTALRTALRHEVLPDDPPATGEELAVQPSYRERRISIARDPGPVGVSVAILDHSGADADVVRVLELGVLPAHRRLGVGRALLDDLIGFARTTRRTLLIGSSINDAGAAFARAAGATPGIVEQLNRLDLTKLDSALLDRWMADAPPGYSLKAWEGRVPDPGLVQPLCDLLTAMNDAPMSPGLEPMQFTPERYVANQESMERRGATGWHVAAIHDASGELAGYTEIGFDPARPHHMEQGQTCVAAHHRGHRIGRWIKAANLLRVLEQRPTVRWVDTDNAATNSHMLAINDELGFAPVLTWQGWELRVGAS